MWIWMERIRAALRGIFRSEQKNTSSEGDEVHKHSSLDQRGLSRLERYNQRRRRSYIERPLGGSVAGGRAQSCLPVKLLWNFRYSSPKQSGDCASLLLDLQTGLGSVTQSHKSIGKKPKKNNRIRKPIGVCSLVYLLIISTSIYRRSRTRICSGIFFTLMWQLVEERFEIRWDIRKTRINTRAAFPRWQTQTSEKCLQSGRKKSPSFITSPASLNAILLFLKLN